MDKRDGLPQRFALYARVHHDRRNLVLHILTVPLFMAGTVALALAWHWPWLAAAGPAAILAAMAAQGRGHKHEVERPAPFAGPLDVVKRIFVEQWVTFPRFVASGGFARAWRGQE